MGELWDRRMDHLHHRELKVLRESMASLSELRTEHNNVCKGCALGTYSKATFPSSDSRAMGILELVHLDICGPISS